MPGFERREKLEDITVGSDMHLDVFAILWGRLIERRAIFEMRREFFGVWWTESERFSVWCSNDLC